MSTPTITRHLGTSILATLIAGGSANAATIYVAACGDDAWTGASGICAAPDGPKQQISAAMAVASDGDEIVVGPGTYLPIEFNGVPLTVRSTDPLDPGVVAGTIIDATGISFESCIFVGSGNGADTIIEGFTLTGGSGRVIGSLRAGGGVFLFGGSSPTVRDCVIIDNVANEGGGLYIDGGSPTIERCDIEGNGAVDGGGAKSLNSDATFVDCRFEANWATFDGGGLAANGAGDTPMFTGCRFIGNNALNDHGGAARCGGDGLRTFVNCAFIDNEASGSGGAIISTSGADVRFFNCSFSGNVAGANQGAVRISSASSAFMRNCVAWGNGPDPVDGPGSRSVQYCNIQGGGFSGDGNIVANPLFVDPVAGDLRLQAGSPCIDAANNGAVPLGVTADLDGEPRFTDDLCVIDTGLGAAPIVDMGAFERIATLQLSVPGDFATIQAAITAACDGQSIDVAPGTYVESIDFLGKPITVRSTDGPEETIIDGTGAEDFVVKFVNGEGADSVLHGFTITNAPANPLGAVLADDGSEPTIRNCVITDNDYYGVRSIGSAPRLDGCIVTNNGLGFKCSGSPVVVTNCVVRGNAWGFLVDGGGSDVTITNCIVTDNSINVHDLFDQATISYSLVGGGWTGAGTGNIDADPLFVDAANGNLRLRPGSPCLDAGLNAAVPAGVVTDLDGNLRFVDSSSPDCPQAPGECGDAPIVDMGPYELQLIPCPTDIDGDGATGFGDLIAVLVAWGPCACPEDLDGSGEVGFGDLVAVLAAWGPCE